MVFGQVSRDTGPRREGREKRRERTSYDEPYLASSEARQMAKAEREAAIAEAQDNLQAEKYKSALKEKYSADVTAAFGVSPEDHKAYREANIRVKELKSQLYEINEDLAAIDAMPKSWMTRVTGSKQERDLRQEAAQLREKIFDQEVIIGSIDGMIDSQSNAPLAGGRETYSSPASSAQKVERNIKPAPVARTRAREAAPRAPKRTVERAPQRKGYEKYSADVTAEFGVSPEEHKAYVEASLRAAELRSKISGLEGDLSAIEASPKTLWTRMAGSPEVRKIKQEVAQLNDALFAQEIITGSIDGMIDAQSGAPLGGQRSSFAREVGRGRAPESARTAEKVEDRFVELEDEEEPILATSATEAARSGDQEIIDFSSFDEEDEDLQIPVKKPVRKRKPVEVATGSESLSEAEAQEAKNAAIIAAALESGKGRDNQDIIDLDAIDEEAELEAKRAKAIKEAEGRDNQDIIDLDDVETETEMAGRGEVIDQEREAVVELTSEDALDVPKYSAVDAEKAGLSAEEYDKYREAYYELEDLNDELDALNEELEDYEGMPQGVGDNAAQETRDQIAQIESQILDQEMAIGPILGRLESQTESPMSDEEREGLSTRTHQVGAGKARRGAGGGTGGFGRDLPTARERAEVRTERTERGGAEVAETAVDLESDRAERMERYTPRIYTAEQAASVGIDTEEYAAYINAAKELGRLSTEMEDLQTKLDQAIEDRKIWEQVVGSPAERGLNAELAQAVREFDDASATYGATDGTIETRLATPLSNQDDDSGRSTRVQNQRARQARPTGTAGFGRQ